MRLGESWGEDYSRSLASPETYPEPLQARPNTVPGKDPPQEQQMALAMCVCIHEQHRAEKALLNAPLPLRLNNVRVQVCLET